MKKALVVFIMLFISKIIQGQPNFIPFVNINNGNAHFANTSLEWSFGETIFVNTLVNQNGLIVTGGLLQPSINSSYTKIHFFTIRSNININIKFSKIIENNSFTY